MQKIIKAVYFCLAVWLDTDIFFYISVCCDDHLDTDPLQPNY